MADVTTPDLSNVTMQVMADAGINPFAVQLVVESYAKRVNPEPVAFVWRGVIVQLRPMTVVAQPCTGVAARWCPNCGSCTDKPEAHENPDTYPHSDHCSDRDCPLHGVKSQHADANDVELPTAPCPWCERHYTAADWGEHYNREHESQGKAFVPFDLIERWYYATDDEARAMTLDQIVRLYLTGK